MTIQELQQKYGQPKPIAKPPTTGVGMLQAKYGSPSRNGFPTATPPAVSQSFNEKLNSYLHRPAFDMGENRSGVIGTGLKSVVNSTKSLVANTKALADFAHLDPIAYPDQAKELLSVPGQLWETAKSQVDANVAQKLADDGIDRVLQKIQEKRAKGEDTSHLENYLKQPGVITDTKAQGTIAQILGDLTKAGYESSVPPALQDAFKGEGTKALQSVAQDPYQLAPLFLIAKGFADKKLIVAKDPITGKPILDAKGNPTYKSALETKVGEKIDKGISKVAEIATKPITVPAKGAIRIGQSLAKFGTSQATGLSPKTIETIINDPKAFSKAEQAQFSREGIASEVKKTLDERITDLSELGKGYESIRNSTAKVDLPIETVGEILNKYKIDVDANGRVRTTQESIPMSQGDISALQNFIDIFNTPRLSANAFLNARTALSNMAKFDTTKTNASTTFARELRAAYDKAGKEQIPGLKELDSVFSVERTALQKIKRDYLNADGTFKDGAVSKIANLNRAGREQVLARLEAILPGIGRKIAILNAIEDIAAAQGQKVGTYTRGILGGAGLVSGNLVAIVGAILSSPHIAAKILRGYGKLKGIPKEVIEKTIKKVEQILTSDVSDLTKKAKIGLSIEDVSAKGTKPNSLNPLDDTGSAAKNRLNKYETEALKEAKTKVDPLITAARKYKSAEEFVRAQQPRVGGIAPELKGETLYRGMSESEWKAIQDGGLSGKRGDGRTYLTTEKETAQMAVDEGVKSGKGEGVIVELKPEAGQKVISGGKIGENTGGNLRGEYQGKDIGIDDIARVTDSKGNVIYEASTGGKTKSQLTDIWNKANKK